MYLVLKWANRNRLKYLTKYENKIDIIPYQDSFQQEYRKLEMFYRLNSSIAANDLYPIKGHKTEQNEIKKKKSKQNKTNKAKHFWKNEKPLPPKNYKNIKYESES